MICIIILTISLVAINAAPLAGNTDSDYIDDGEFGDKFEGDMLLTDVQRLTLYTAIDFRNGLVDGAKRWPNKVIVYKIEEDFGKLVKIL